MQIRQFSFAKKGFIDHQVVAEFDETQINQLANYINLYVCVRVHILKKNALY